MGPGLPIGKSLVVVGPGTAFLTESLGGAWRACANISRWYFCIFLLTSLLFRSCVDVLFFLPKLLNVGICSVVGGAGQSARGVDERETSGDI
jgi:hypothetical protein